jgi:hypothetical protein
MMGFFSTGNDGPDVDKLILGTLRAPMLTQVLQSQEMKADLGAVANEVKSRYLSLYQAKARQSGNLGSTAKVTYHRRRTKYDNRWEAEFSVGGAKAPYVLEVEARDHILAETLRSMGFNVGDVVRVAPPGQA